MGAHRVWLRPGDQVTTFSFGSTDLGGMGLSFPPSFQIWFRLGPGQEIFRGTRDSHTFVAESEGELELASYFPGEWGTRKGALGLPAGVYAMATGSFSVLAVRWCADALSGLRQLAGGDPTGLVASDQDIVELKGLVQGNTIRAKHVGRDIGAGLKNLVGGELKAYTELMAEARREAVDRMLAQAVALGANAVVNVRFTTSQVANGAAELYAYGTAVVAAPRPAHAAASGEAAVAAG